MDMKRMFVDTETTGTDSRINCIHQLSGCLEINGIVVEEFDFKIRPFKGCIIKKEALEVSGVTEDEIMQYPPEMESYYEFKNMLARHINEFDKTQHWFIIGYNVKFDAEFINAMFLRNDDLYFYSLCWGNVIDAMSLASDMLASIRYTMSDFRLNTVARQLGIIVDETKLHNAQYDIEVTRAVYYKVKRPDIYDITDIQNDEITKINSVDKNLVNEIKIDKPLCVHTSIDTIIEQPAKSIAHLFSPTESWSSPGNIIKLYQNLDDISQEEIQAALKDIWESNKKENIIDLNENSDGPWNLKSEEDRHENVKESFLKQTENLENTSSVKKIELKPKIMVKVDDYFYKMTFGKHEGEIINDIIDYDPQYILWLDEKHIRNIFVSKEIMNAALKQDRYLQNSTPLFKNTTKPDFDNNDDLPF